MRERDKENLNFFFKKKNKEKKKPAQISVLVPKRYALKSTNGFGPSRDTPTYINPKRIEVRFLKMNFIFLAR